MGGNQKLNISGNSSKRGMRPSSVWSSLIGWFSRTNKSSHTGATGIDDNSESKDALRRRSKREKKVKSGAKKTSFLKPPKEDTGNDHKSVHVSGNTENKTGMEAVSSIPATPMFGCCLEDSLDEASGVAKFVVWCVEAVKTTGDGLDTDAIYRASGNRRKVLDIMETSESEMQATLTSELNIHVLTGALKTYFRDLREPLLTLEQCSPYFQDDDWTTEDRRQQLRQNVIFKLPAVKRSTLQFILQHLSEVVAHESNNKMTARSVAVVFGPNIIRSHDAGNQSEQLIAVTQFLLTNCEALFVDADTSVASVTPTRASVELCSGVKESAMQKILVNSQLSENEIIHE